MQANQQPFQADLTSYTSSITLNCCPISHQQQLEAEGGGHDVHETRQFGALIVHEGCAIQRMCPELHHKVMRNIRLEVVKRGHAHYDRGVFLIRSLGGAGT